MIFPATGGAAVFGFSDVENYTATLADVERWLAERVTPSPAPSKATENKVRRAAQRHGLTLQRQRTRDPRAAGFGKYTLASAGGTLVIERPVGLDAIEQHLKEL